MKKWLWCSWVHFKHRCYPEVWRPLDDIGPWHCTECTSCFPHIDDEMMDQRAREDSSGGDI